MLYRCLCLLVCLAALLCRGALAIGPDPSRDWRTLDSAHFRIHFDAKDRQKAREFAGLAEEIYPRVTGSLQWAPAGRTEVVLLDALDVANGMATPLPFNEAIVFLTPPDAGELLQNGDWLRLVFTHEFVHVVHLDKAARGPLALRSIFGRFAFLFPNVWQPDWFTEGLAVQAESLAGQKVGRLFNSHFEAMMRAEVAAGVKSLREVNADGRGFPLNRAYLYGAYFHAFLGERYGPEASGKLVAGYSDNLLPFRVHSNPLETTGKPMDALWAEYQDWLLQRFAGQRRQLAATPEQVGQEVLRAWAVSSPVQGRDGSLYFVRSDGYTRPQLVRRGADGKTQVLAEVEVGARLDVNARGDVLVAQPEIVDHYNYFYDLYLWRADAWLGARQGLHRLTTGGRYRLAVFAGEGIVAVQNDAGQARVVRLDTAGQEPALLFTAAADEAISGLAVAPGGEAIAFTGQRAGGATLYEWRAGAVHTLLRDAAIKHSPRYADDGRLLLVADYGNVANVWGVDRAAGRLERLSHAGTAVLETSAPVAGALYLTVLAADGAALRRMELAAPVERRSLRVETLAAADMEGGGARTPAAVDTSEREYAAWRSLWPRAWFPLLFAGDGALGLGVTVNGRDALGLHSYLLQPIFEFTQHEQLGTLRYEYNQRHSVWLQRDMEVTATRQDADDDTEVATYKIHEHAQWLSLAPWQRLNRRLYVGIGAALDRELHKVNDGATVRATDERVAALLFGYDSRRGQWLSEGSSQGVALSLIGESYDPAGKRLGGPFRGEVVRADARAHLPLGPTVLALRYVAGRAGNAAEPFELGGTFSEPDAVVLPFLNQRDYALRGYNNGEPLLRGRRLRLGTLEWRVPLADVDRHLMVPPVGLNRVSANLFYEAGAAWNEGSPDKYYRSGGVELLAELRLGYLLGLQLRAGWAHAVDAPGADKAYLKVGRAF